MVKNYKDLCNLITLFFDKVENTQQLHTIEIPGYSRHEINEILYQCINSDYILNVNAYRDGNGTPHFDSIGLPCVSITGYQFLNSLRSDIALAKARKANIKGWIALLISALTFVIYVLEQMDVIKPFIETLLELSK